MKPSKGVWLGVWTISLAAAAGNSPCTAAEAPLVAVNSNHWGQGRGHYNGPFDTDVYGFNADGTSFPGWSGSYGALIGPGRWGIPLPDASSWLSRAEGLTDVSYAHGSLYVATFLMGMGDVFRVDPRSGLPNAGIGNPVSLGDLVNSDLLRVGWVPAPITRVPGYAGFLAADPYSGPTLTANWFGQLSAPQAGPDGTLYFDWTGWWSAWEATQRYGPIVSFYSGYTREILRYTGDPLHPQVGDWTAVVPDAGLDAAWYSTSALLVTPDNRLLLGAPDGLRAYDATSGQFLNTLVRTGEGGLRNPSSLTLGNGDTLFVTDLDTDQILRFDSRTGAPLGPLNLLDFQLLTDPVDLDFLDGQRDTLLVSQRQSPYLVRISHVNGPGPALAEPFTPLSESLFGPVEYSMSIAVIPEATPGWMAGLAGATAGLGVLGNIRRRACGPRAVRG